MPSLQIKQFTERAVCHLPASVLRFTERRLYALHLSLRCVEITESLQHTIWSDSVK